MEHDDRRPTILLAGASGAIGRRLLPMLVEAGYPVLGTTRRVDSGDLIARLGGRPVVVDAFDRTGIFALFERERPEIVIHQLTDLSARDYAANSRLRIDGTRNLVDAAKKHSVQRFVAQSIAFVYEPHSALAVESDPLDVEGDPNLRNLVRGVQALEQAVAEMPEGVVLRYGLLYGPGTWISTSGEHAVALRRGDYLPPPEISSFIHVDDAASAARHALKWTPGIYNIVDDDPASPSDWLPLFAEAIGASVPVPPQGDVVNNGASNAKARRTGWTPSHPTWRTGFLTALD